MNQASLPIAEGNGAADERGRQSEEHREEAVQDARAAREEAARSEQAAEHARDGDDRGRPQVSLTLGRWSGFMGQGSTNSPGRSPGGAERLSPAATPSRQRRLPAPAEQASRKRFGRNTS
ncbi:hypothetical protein [Streptomyces sp. NPDC002324]